MFSIKIIKVENKKKTSNDKILNIKTTTKNEK